MSDKLKGAVFGVTVTILIGLILILVNPVNPKDIEAANRQTKIDSLFQNGISIAAGDIMHYNHGSKMDSELTIRDILFNIGQAWAASTECSSYKENPALGDMIDRARWLFFNPKSETLLENGDLKQLASLFEKQLDDLKNKDVTEQVIKELIRLENLRRTYASS